jgi:hypothetical protein
LEVASKRKNSAAGFFLSQVGEPPHEAESNLCDSSAKNRKKYFIHVVFLEPSSGRMTESGISAAFRAELAEYGPEGTLFCAAKPTANKSMLF